MVLFQYVINQTDDYTNQQISKGLYKTDELVVIKIPTRMPYIQEQKQYEAVSGQIELKGHNYNYVALRLTRDTMYVKCIPNYEKTRLVKENLISAKSISDTPLEKKHHVPLEKKSGIDNEYNFTTMFFDPQLNASGLKETFTATTPKILHTHLSTPGQPPELA